MSVPPGEGIEDFVNYLTIERNCPNTTIRAYRNDLEQLAEFLNDKPAATVTIADLRAWLESMDHAPSIIGRKLATARSYFRFGIREGWTDKNPARELDMPRSATPPATPTSIATSATTRCC